jgi:hypothetical protein
VSYVHELPPRNVKRAAAARLAARTPDVMVGLVVAGVAGTAAFGAQWLSNSHIVEISNVFVLPTFLLGAALFAYAMAMVLEADRRRLPWLVRASAMMAGLLATGARASLILLAAPIAIILGARRHFARRSIRFAIVIPAASLLVVLGVQSLIRFTRRGS